MRIGLDFDGVFSNVADLKVRAAKRLFGKRIPEEHMHKYIVLRKGLLSKEEYDKLQDFSFNTDFGSSMKPVPGMKVFVKRMLREGYDLSVVTSRDGKALEVAKHWLARHGIEIPIHGVGRGTHKTGVTKQLRLDAFVDDDLYKLEPLCGTVQHRYLFSWPYNRHTEESSLVKRVHSWQELYKEISMLSVLYLSGKIEKPIPLLD
jgi:uncharacterized HAD superfamily protein